MTLRAIALPTAVTLGLLLLLGGLTQFAVVLLRASAVPSLSGLFKLVLVVLPVGLPLMLSVGVFVGVLTAMGRWRATGQWIGLQALGVQGRQVARAMGLVGGLCAIAVALCTQLWAPWGHRAAAGVLAQAAADLRLVPGQFLAVGDVILHQGSGGEWIVAGSDWIGGAATGSIAVVGGSPIVTLERGAVAGTDGAWLSFHRAEFALPTVASQRRIELSERSNAGLSQVIAATERAGRDASYERMVLYKRFALPFASFCLPFLALAMGLRWGSHSGSAGVVILGYWVLVRLGDQWCTTLGPEGAAALAPVVLLLFTGSVWAGWRDR